MRATSLLRDIPFDRLRPKDKPTRYFVDNEYVGGELASSVIYKMFTNIFLYRHV